MSGPTRVCIAAVACRLAVGCAAAGPDAPDASRATDLGLLPPGDA